MAVTPAALDSGSDSEHPGESDTHYNDSSNLEHFQVESEQPEASREELASTEDLATPSREALQLLKLTSEVLMKKKRGRKTVIKSLYTQLQCLRSQVPYTIPSRDSCVISDALTHIEKLKEDIQELKDGVWTFDADNKLQKVLSSTTVEVTATEAGLQIHVSCPNKTGLMADLFEALEGLGLVFAKVNASCHDDLTFSALSTQMEKQPIEPIRVKRVLLRTIYSKRNA